MYLLHICRKKFIPLILTEPFEILSENSSCRTVSSPGPEFGNLILKSSLTGKLPCVGFSQPSPKEQVKSAHKLLLTSIEHP